MGKQFGRKPNSRSIVRFDAQAGLCTHGVPSFASAHAVAFFCCKPNGFVMIEVHLRRLPVLVLLLLGRFPNLIWNAVQLEAVLVTIQHDIFAVALLSNVALLYARTIVQELYQGR